MLVIRVFRSIKYFFISIDMEQLIISFYIIRYLMSLYLFINICVGKYKKKLMDWIILYDKFLSYTTYLYIWICLWGIEIIMGILIISKIYIYYL